MKNTRQYFLIAGTLGALAAGRLPAAERAADAQSDLRASAAIVAAADTNAASAGAVYEFDGRKAWLQLPADYAAEPDRRWPAIVFLHGRGGSHLRNNILSESYRPFRALVKQQGYLLAAPDYGANNWFNAQAEEIIGALIRSLQKTHRMDERRLLLMGSSMGGGAALAYAGRHPGEVIGVCDVFGVSDWEQLHKDGKFHKFLEPAFGGPPPADGGAYRERSAMNYIPALARMPVLIIHGEKDRTVPIAYSERLHEALQAAGGNVEFIRVPGKGHDNTIIEGLEPNVLEFFRQCASIPGL